MTTTQRIETVGLIGFVVFALALGVAGVLGLTSPEPPPIVAVPLAWIGAILPWVRAAFLASGILAMVRDRDVE